MSAQRMLFLTIAGLLTTGIWLTEWVQAHWLLYVIVGMLTFAFASGICPGLIVFQKLGFK